MLLHQMLQTNKAQQQLAKTSGEWRAPNCWHDTCKSYWCLEALALVASGARAGGRRRPLNLLQIWLRTVPTRSSHHLHSKSESVRDHPELIKVWTVIPQEMVKGANSSGEVQWLTFVPALSTEVNLEAKCSWSKTRKCHCTACRE